MPIQSIENAKHLKKYGAKLGRQGIAERIIEIAKEIVDGKGAYITTIRNAGKIRALAIACGADGYWEEKQFLGYLDMVYEAKEKAV